MKKKPKPIAPPNQRVVLSEKPVFESIALLALATSAVDGNPTPTELRTFCEAFQGRFSVPYRKVNEIVLSAVQTLRTMDSFTCIDTACKVLNDNLPLHHRVRTFDELAEIVLADKVVTAHEEELLSYIARRIGVVDELRRIVQAA